MKTVNSKAMIKRVKYLLNSVNISFELAKALKWRQLYRLLKKAQKLNTMFEMDKSELKQLSKDISESRFEVSRVSVITKMFKIEVKEEKQKEETFQFVPFVKPFLTFFQDEHPLLLI